MKTVITRHAGTAAKMLAYMLAKAAKDYKTDEDRITFFGETLAMLGTAAAEAHHYDPVSLQLAILHRVAEHTGCEIDSITVYEEEGQPKTH